MHLSHSPEDPPGQSISLEQFLTVDIRVGKIIEAELLTEVRKPALRLLIDFGSTIGEKKSIAQITTHYDPKNIVGRQVAGVVNFLPRQIGTFLSEVLTVGFADENGEVVLFSPDRVVPNGSRLF